jgi:hypothetical protein
MAKEVITSRFRPPDQSIHEAISEDRTAYHQEPARIASFRLYARGEVQLQLTAKQKAILKGITGHEFCDNLCHEVIAGSRDRLTFLRWECPDQTVNDELGDFYKYARLLDRQGEIHYDSMRDGNHAVGLMWETGNPLPSPSSPREAGAEPEYDNYSPDTTEDQGKVKLYREDWWDGCSGVFIAYDCQDDPVYAVKEWKTKDTPTKWRRNIWFTDRLERWISDDGINWDGITLQEDEGLWPFPWLNNDGTPMGIPYIHYPNAGRGSLIRNYGISELDGGVRGYQDQINDLQWAMSGAGRMTAYLIYYIFGIARGTNLTVGPGELWKADKADVKAGTLQPGDMKPLLDLYNQKLRSFARMTRTPLHIITGDWPSGEALMRAEQPAIGKANSQKNKYMDCWSRVGHTYVKIRNRFSGKPPLNADLVRAPISSVFSSVERRDPLSLSLIVANLKDIISPQEAMRMMERWSDDQINQIMKEKQDNQQALLDAQQTAFDRGTAPGSSLPGSGGPGL